MNLSNQTKKLLIPFVIWIIILGLVLSTEIRIKLMHLSNSLSLGYVTDVVTGLIYIGGASIPISVVILLLTQPRKTAILVSLLICTVTALLESFANCYIRVIGDHFCNLYFYGGGFLLVFGVGLFILISLILLLNLINFFVEFSKELK
jgi:hypothetical protein